MIRKPRPCPEWVILLTPVPALALGITVMRSQAVPGRIWGQQLLTGLLLLVISEIYMRVQGRGRSQILVFVAMLGAILLLAGTFLDSGIGGVHRWIRLGPAVLYSAAIAAPLLIIALGRPAMDSRGWPTFLGGGGVALALALQPDAAQTTAFCGALLTLWLLRPQRTAVTWMAMLALLGCVALAWARPDPLPPVRYVEGIVLLAAKGGFPLLLMALGALALLPLPFFLCAPRGVRCSRAWALGIYVSTCLLAPMLGAFPVPVMGFGASPMLGYFLALTWLLSSRQAPGALPATLIPPAKDRP
jgi:hypothetical protein